METYEDIERKAFTVIEAYRNRAHQPLYRIEVRPLPEDASRFGLFSYNSQGNPMGFRLGGKNKQIAIGCALVMASQHPAVAYLRKNGSKTRVYPRFHPPENSLIQHMLKRARTGSPLHDLFVLAKICGKHKLERPLKALSDAVIKSRLQSL